MHFTEILAFASFILLASNVLGFFVMCAFWTYRDWRDKRARASRFIKSGQGRYLAGPLALIFCFILSARAQPSNTPVPPPTLSLTNGPVNGAVSFINQLFTFHDPTLQFFTDTNSIQGEFGAALHSYGGGASQSAALTYYHRIGANTELGLNGEMETLNVGGQDITFEAAHARLRYDWDNIAGFLGLGPFHDVVQTVSGLEAELGGDWRFSKKVGGFAKYCPGFQFGSGVNHQKIPWRIVVGANIAVGK